MNGRMNMKKAAALLFAALLACFCLAAPWAAPAESSDSNAPAVDLDLSKMSGTVVYAQIYQMAVHPEEYLGKRIRLAGWFDVFADGESGMLYTVCYIPDASACCAQGIEFVWAGEHAFPEEYPEAGTPILVTGRFETYFEGEWEYMRLADAELVRAAEE